MVVVASGPASKLTGVQKNDSFAWLPSEAESTQVLDRMKAFQSPDEIPAIVVYSRDGGVTPADFAAVKQQVAKFNSVENVKRDSLGPFPSKDGEALQVVVPIDAGTGGWQTLLDVVDGMHGDLGSTTPDGLNHYVTGPAGYAAESAEAFNGIDGRLLGIAALVVIVILLFTYRSPVLWILPLISAGIALFVAQGVIYFLAKYADLTVNGQSQGILTVLVFGAGTDYALLLVARYREELRRHEDRHEAMAFALHRAAPAIVASASTVVLAMVCLLVAEMNSTAGLGPVAAIGIAVGLLVMLTLLPALLVITGRWVFWPVRPRFGTVEPTSGGFWARVGRRISTRPRRVWVGTALVLAALSLGMLSLNAHGLSTADS